MDHAVVEQRLQHQGVVVGHAKVVDLRVELFTCFEQQLSRSHEHRRTLGVVVEVVPRELDMPRVAVIPAPGEPP